MRKNQLLLITTDTDSDARRAADLFRLDDRTREVGRQGVAAAREALRAALAARAA